MKFLILLVAGFLIHLLRDYDRARTTISNSDYIKKNSLKIVGSFIMSLCLFAVLRVDSEITGIAALTVGYSGDSFFRYLIEKNFPNAKF
jgi:hypothetical protein